MWNVSLRPRALLARSGAAPFDIFVVAGQSNNHYGDPLNAGIDIGHARLFQWNQAGAIVSGAEPLDHVDRQATLIGHAVAWARDYYIPNALAAGRRVLLVPCAKGGTGFVTNEWNPGDPLYNAAISRTLAALAAAPVGSVIKGCLWHQGENDAQAAVSGPTYRANLEAMIAGMRSGLSSSQLPFILGGMTDQSVGQTGGAIIEHVIRQTTNRLNYTGFANSQLPSALGALNVHFTAAEQRTFAGRYWTAWQAALLNVWASSFSATLSSELGGNVLANYSIRQVLPAALLSQSGSQVRVTFKALAASAMKIDNVAIVERTGATADGTAVPTELLFDGGGHGFTGVAGLDVTSDPLTFAVDETKDYLVIYDLASTDGNHCYNDALTGATGYYKPSTDSYNQQNGTGFSVNPTPTVFGVSKVEVRT